MFLFAWYFAHELFAKTRHLQRYIFFVGFIMDVSNDFFIHNLRVRHETEILGE